MTLNTRGNPVVRFKKYQKSSEEARDIGARIVAAYENKSFQKAKTVRKTKETKPTERETDANAVIETLTEPDTDPNEVIETLTERETDETTTRRRQLRRKAVREGASMVWRHMDDDLGQSDSPTDSVDDKDVWSPGPPKNGVDGN